LRNQLTLLSEDGFRLFGYAHQSFAILGGCNCK
jgi:hypothetical protein